MDPQQIKAFIEAMAASDLDEMEVGHDGWTLRLVRHGRSGHRAQPAPVPEAIVAQPARAAVMASPAARDDSGMHDVKAPLFGVVQLQPSAGEPPFVKPGDVVEAGQVLCTIEAMKVFNEVRADRGGRVTAVLVESGAEVDAGQSLLMIERPQADALRRPPPGGVESLGSGPSLTQERPQAAQTPPPPEGVRKLGSGPSFSQEQADDV